MKKTIKLVGEIAWYAISAEYIESQLEGLTEEDTVEFVIHSGGGSVFEGAYIYNLLLKCPAKKIGEIYGISASMMTILGLAMDELYMCPISMYMTHNVSGGTYGNSKDFEQTKKLLEKLDSILLEGYKKRGISEIDIKSKLMNGLDNWFTPKECLELGLIDGIREPNKGIIEEDSELSEYNYNDLMDVAAASVENRSKALNKLVTLNFSQMENTDSNEKQTQKIVPTATSETTDMIAALNLELDNHKQIIKSKETEISNLSSKVTELEKEKDDAILAAQNEVRKAKEDLEKVSNSIAEKDKQLYNQEVVNRVNLAVAKIQVNGKALENDKQKELSNAFRNRRSCVIEGEKESVIDRYSNEVVGDSIEAALRHYAKEGGYVPTQMQGINASSNLTSNDFSFNTAQNSANEEKAILRKQKELNKQGFSDYSKPYVAAMLAEFGNSENPHIQALKKLNF